MHAPAKIDVGDLSDYLAAMSRAALEPGLNWEVVEKKWPGIVEAFDGFDVMRVADYGPEDLERLMADARVIRNRAKLQAIVHNAGEMLMLEKEVGFRAYLRSKPSYEALVADMRKRFKFLGESGIYHFLYVVKEPVPAWEDWMASHPGSNASKKWSHGG
jgi:3-methyladenine DNA glycosylase Tag